MEYDSNRLTTPDGADILKRLWAKDPTLWSVHKDQLRSIEDRLGWLTAPEWFRNHVCELQERVKKIREANWQRVVLLGMGGSSLAAEVLVRAFASQVTCCSFVVLDSAHPTIVRRLTEMGNLENTLFLVSSKSGLTLEVTTLWSHFDSLLRDKRLLGDKAGHNFVAITDAGTPLEALAEEKKFRDCFINPPDVGGRFSALTYFGMVPAALLGLDLYQFVEGVDRQVAACKNLIAEKNNFFQLGWSMGAQALLGRNKLTLWLCPEIAALGSWIEQLLAESTGKDGLGIVPIVNEPLQMPEHYSSDRFFVVCAGDDSGLLAHYRGLEAAGLPRYSYWTGGLSEIGGEMFGWELAPSVAGIVLGVNPFDEPDVQRSKDATGLFLTDRTRSGSAGFNLLIEDNVMEVVTGLHGDIESSSDISKGFAKLFGVVSEGDYVVILAWLDENEGTRVRLEALRMSICEALGVPVTVNFGPRYLHSTGQLHKGGPNTAVILQFLDSPVTDIAIPGHGYSFADLTKAQANADLTVLFDLGRRVARLNLGEDPCRGLDHLVNILVDGWPS